jgi:hypothetical protein
MLVAAQLCSRADRQLAFARSRLLTATLGASDVRIARLGIFIGVMAYAIGTWSTAAALECGRNLVVTFRRVPLNPGERVVGIKLTVVGGSVVGVGSIPRDWSISVEPEVSGAASVSGSPQHGAGALESTEALPAVTVRGHNCTPAPPSFALSAVVHVTHDFASSRTIDIDQRMLRIW